MTTSIRCQSRAVVSAMASHDTVTMEDLADHTIRRLDVNAPRELQDSLGPQQTPSGRPIQRLQMTVREPSEIMLAIAQGRIAQPVTSTFAHTYRHPDVVFVLFSDLPPGRSVLVWRRRDRHPGLREFLRIARSEVKDGSTKSDKATPRPRRARTPSRAHA